MHNLSLLSIVSEELAMHRQAIFNICTKNENMVQIYGALSAYIQNYKSSIVYCSGLSEGDSIIWCTDKEKCLRELFFFYCLTFCRAMCKTHLAVSQLLSNHCYWYRHTVGMGEAHRCTVMSAVPHLLVHRGNLCLSWKRVSE